MGNHRVWRKIAKRERRRRIRKKKGKDRDFLPDGEEYEIWIKEQEALDVQILEQIEISNKIENEKWLAAESVALVQWRKIQIKNEMLLQKELQQKAKLQQEWEMEKQRKEREAERLKELEEENCKRQEEFMTNLEKFLIGDSREPPQELQILYESRPHCDPCPFYAKTACCRFGDECSRNHKHPGISRVLLAQNLFGHFGLENSNFNEYDTDIMLEYEDSDTYKDFKDFFFDVLPEFQKFGKVVEFKCKIKNFNKYLINLTQAPSHQVHLPYSVYSNNILALLFKAPFTKVCNNVEKHLRGNTYIEFAELPSAVSAYQALHTRWYGGKQISLQFCRIFSWSNAICGLQRTRRCPKGRACNFLHVFKNPIKLYEEHEKRFSRRQERSTTRSWRWSESPERECHTPSKSRKEDDSYSSSKGSRHYRHRELSRSRSHRNRD